MKDTKLARDYCEHHCHGEYSLLDGTGVAEAYAARAVELGYTHLNKTEHGTVAGLLHHIRACRKVGIIPVCGMEAYFKPNRFLQDSTWKDDPKHYKREFHLTVTANSLKGWQNLMKMSSLAWIEGFYGRPCLDYDLLEKYGEGIVVSSACIASYLSQALIAGDEASAKYFTDRVRKAVGNRFYIELMPHDWEDQKNLNILLTNFALKEGIPLLATNDVHYPTKEFAPTQGVLMMCSTGMTNLKKKAKKEAGEQVYGDSKIDTLYLMNGDEIFNQFQMNHPDIPESIVEEAIRNSVEITKDFKPYIINKDYKVPKAINDDEKAKKALRDWSEEGLNNLVERWRKLGQSEEEISSKIVVYKKRLNYELEIFTNLDVYHYMVLIADLVRWAKSDEGIENGTKKVPIRVGLGRGSAAGSLVSFLTGITGIDPIAWGLLFERFINPERSGLPDIDIDFDSDRREEVKQYTIAKYGEDKVATVSTKSTFAAASVVQRISKIFDDQIPYSEATAVTDEIEKSDKNLMAVYNSNEKTRAFADKYPEPWEHMLRLEDQVANDGKHPSAVVITDRPLMDTMPLETRDNKKTGKRDIVTSWTDSAAYPIIADYGYLKADYLATKGVTKIEEATQEVRTITGDPTFEPNDMELLINPDAFDEDVVKEVFGKGLTLGVFQFGGSDGIIKYMKQLKPDTVQHLVAANALYRPGPIAFLDTFANRRHQKEGWNSWGETTDEIMDPTYGIMLYQEQVMEIAKTLGGFTGGQADSLRKAIGKLYRLGKEEAQAAMEVFKIQWDEGTAENGVDSVLAQEIWNYILEFAGYGFNKSHSACYGVQGYQDGWFKYHYPEIFYKVLLSRQPELISAAMEEAKHFGVTISPPDVNKSGIGFTINREEKSLTYGLTAIRDMGIAAAKPIVDERAANGPYASIDDLLDRLPNCNSGSLKSLAWAGGFNSIGNQVEILSEYERTNKVVAHTVDGKKKNKNVKSDEDLSHWMNKQNWSDVIEPENIERLERVKKSISYIDLYKDNQKLKTKIPFAKVSEPSKTDLYDGERWVLGHNILHLNPIYDPENAETIAHYVSSPDEILCAPTSKELQYNQRDQSKVQIAGEVTNYKAWKIKSGANKGRHMAKFSLSYYQSTFEIVIFTKDFEQLEVDIQDGDALIMVANKMAENEFSAKTVWKIQDFMKLVKNEKE